MSKCHKYTLVGKVKSDNGEKFNIFIRGKNKKIVYAFRSFMSTPFSPYDIEYCAPDAVVVLATQRVKTTTKYRNFEWYDLAHKTVIGIGCQLFNETEFYKIKDAVEKLEL